MPTGRMFTVGRDAHFSGVRKTLECADDKEAVEKRRNLRRVSILEIWDDARTVVRLPGSLSLK
jgi:hypothetical protein